MNPHEMSDRELQVYALRMWANYVETRDVSLSADDLLAQKKTLTINRNGMRLSLRLRDLADKLESEK